MPHPNRKCSNCGRRAPASEQMYTLRMEIFARKEPLVVKPADLQGDLVAQMEKLVAQMEKMDAEQVAEAHAQVYEQYQFDLCETCRDTMHRQLKDRERLDQLP